MTEREFISTMPDLPSADRRRLILIVEDEFVNREILRMILEQDYETAVAETGAEAMAFIRENRETLSLVLLDLNLPDGHGLDILRKMKEDELTSRLPVIVLTSDKEAEVESLNSGASDFISKPYPMNEIIRARIRRTIELSENRDLIRWTERDQLTGLYNRDYFYRYADRYDVFHKDEPTDALNVDVSRFHMINERYGKAAGDEMLRRIARELRRLVGPSGGIVCRREADTFQVYCPHREDYAAFADSVAAAACGDGMGKIRIRIGVFPNVDKSMEMAHRFHNAKQAADQIRGSYTRTVAFYDDELHAKEAFAERLLDGFQAALDRKQFVVYFQPKYDIRPDTPLLCGAEALVRWKHPELGMVSPGVFIPLFESNGLIRELDNYVWRESAAQLGVWKRRFGSIVPVSVNMSRIDVLDPALTGTLRKLVMDNALDYSDLHLEVTESAYTQDADQILSTVRTLREMGFIIEMDDFGSGYSSLNMISTLPIDVLKLDMQFIRTAFSENGDTRMLEIVCDISRLLQVPMIAEGVETKEQMRALRELGCDIAQGYCFARPMPAEEFEQYLTRREWHADH